MSLQSVKDFFSAHQLDIEIIELDVSTATVALAAEDHGVEPGQIAKTLAFQLNDGRVVLVVAKGDARIDNKKFKDQFQRENAGIGRCFKNHRPPSGWCLPFWPCVASSRLLRCLTENLQRSYSRCRFNQQCGSNKPRKNGRHHPG